MTKRVYKYEITPDGSAVDAAILRPLSVGVIDHRLYLWAEVEIGGVSRPRRFYAYPTGHTEIPAQAEYVGTALMRDGSLVWHVYEIPAEDKRDG